VKPSQIPLSKGIQIFDPFCWKLFFLGRRCKKGVDGQVASNSKVPRISSEFLFPINS
jgi:hypothetical protein